MNTCLKIFTRPVLCSTLLLVASLNVIAPALAQALIESEQILTPPPPTENRNFGRSVAIYERTVVASGWSTNTTTFGDGLGELFFYDLNGTDWQVSQTYVHPRTLPDELGASLALDRDVLVAGAPWFNLQSQISGYAQKFVREGTNWIAADLLRGDQLYNVGPFGGSVAASGETIAILNPEESVRNPENPSVELAIGAVYIHDPLLLTKLSATNSNTTNRFSAVALSSDTLFVASGNDAVVFFRTGGQWSFHSVLSPSGTNFPGLALDGSIAVVNGYVFLRSGSNWTEFQKIVPSTTNSYGPPVAIDGGTIVVGGNGAVSVFDFTRTNFVESLVLNPSNASGFGASVAISDRRIVVGAPGSMWTDAGAVHIYTRATAPVRPATALADIVNGYLVGLTIIDGGAGYTYAPPIHILGGGGSGASVVATVQNGTVIDLRVLAPGSGYISAPTMLIDSPANPLSPPIVAVSQPSWIDVDLHLVLGKEYLFESSSDLRSWTQLTNPFLAEEPILTGEFPVEESAQFFRLTPMPECPE